MCFYRGDTTLLRAGLEANRPATGQLLDDLLAWNPETNPAGCLCTRANQDHKWRMVLHTIHFALCGEEDGTPSETKQ